MRGRLRTRMGVLDGEAGMTLIELLVAMIMGIIVVGGATAMLISAVRDQPQQSKQAENVSTARFELERLTREIRNGVKVTSSSSSAKVSFVARLRRTTCGGAVPTNPSTPARECQVTYTCGTTSCSRVEGELGKETGTVTTVVTGINSSEVFCFVPSSNADPTVCGPAKPGTTPTYVGVTLRVPNPSGSGLLTVSDGASLRSATLSF
jgi:type IV pilus assembly protein PilW